MGRKAQSHKSNVCKLFELVLSEGTLAYMILLFSIVKVLFFVLSMEYTRALRDF